MIKPPPLWLIGGAMGALAGAIFHDTSLWVGFVAYVIALVGIFGVVLWERTWKK